MEIADYVVAAFNKMTESCAGQWPKIWYASYNSSESEDVRG